MFKRKKNDEAESNVVTDAEVNDSASENEADSGEKPESNGSGEVKITVVKE